MRRRLGWVEGVAIGLSVSLGLAVALGRFDRPSLCAGAAPVSPAPVSVGPTTSADLLLHEMLTHD